MKIMICDDVAKDADQAKKVILSMGGIHIGANAFMDRHILIRKIIIVFIVREKMI